MSGMTIIVAKVSRSRRSWMSSLMKMATKRPHEARSPRVRRAGVNGVHAGARQGHDARSCSVPRRRLPPFRPAQNDGVVIKNCPARGSSGR